MVSEENAEKLLILGSLKSLRSLDLSGCWGGLHKHEIAFYLSQFVGIQEFTSSSCETLGDTNAIQAFIAKNMDPNLKPIAFQN